MRRLEPIRDAAVDALGKLVENSGFLRAERNLLETRGWSYQSRYNALDAARTMSPNFEESVRRAFSFVQDFGFQWTNVSARVMRCESHTTFLELRWGRLSGELDAVLGLLPGSGTTKDQYSIFDAVRMSDSSATRTPPPQVRNDDDLPQFVSHLARLVVEFAEPALRGDRMFFRRLDTARSAYAERAAISSNVAQVRHRAEQAWREKNYERVVSLYESIAGDLTDAEAHKLRFAKGRHST